jgi:pantoate--beta-alanine ligase
MLIIRRIKKLRQVLDQYRRKGESIGFVPTMGALHAGHLSLIKEALKDNAKTVVSIFVNPAQFGPRDDFREYPRTFNADVRLCKKAGVDIIFYPSIKEIYPPHFKTYVSVESLSQLLCGRSRPGHFRGVATIVAKLFNLVQPDTAYFGEKDAQQAIIIKKMAGDLNFALKIKVLPTLREDDGLAMSSRNAYLNPEERKDAAVLFAALNLAKSLVRSGRHDAAVIKRKLRQLIQQKKQARIDYIAIVDSKTLLPVKKVDANTLIALAVWIGKTRLIDNTVIK